MPYPNEWSCRLINPQECTEFRRTDRKSKTFNKIYSVIWCRLKNTNKWTQQAFRYKKDIWTKEEARKHCQKYNGIFEEKISLNSLINLLKKNQ